MALATASSLSRAVPSTTPAPLPSGFVLDRIFLLRSRRPAGRSSLAAGVRCSFLASLRRHRLIASPFGAASTPPCFSGERAPFGETQREPSNEEVGDDVVEETEGEEPGSALTFTPPALNACEDELSCSTVDALSVTAVTVVVAIVAHTAHGNSHAAASWKKCMARSSWGIRIGSS
jgi:hypothetical protein